MQNNWLSGYFHFHDFYDYSKCLGKKLLGLGALRDGTSWYESMLPIWQLYVAIGQSLGTNYCCNGIAGIGNSSLVQCVLWTKAMLVEI